MQIARGTLSAAVATATFLLAAHGAFPKDAGDLYAKDVDFLLEELGKKAGALLKQKGVDWNAVEKEFRAAVKTVKSDGDHLKLCSRLLARLRDGHAGVVDT